MSDPTHGGSTGSRNLFRWDAGRFSSIAEGIDSVFHVLSVIAEFWRALDTAGKRLHSGYEDERRKTSSSNPNRSLYQNVVAMPTANAVRTAPVRYGKVQHLHGLAEPAWLQEFDQEEIDRFLEEYGRHPVSRNEFYLFLKEWS